MSSGFFQCPGLQKFLTQSPYYLTFLSWYLNVFQSVKGGGNKNRITCGHIPAMNAVLEINVADATSYETHVKHPGTKGSKTLKRENIRKVISFYAQPTWFVDTWNILFLVSSMLSTAHPYSRDEFLDVWERTFGFFRIVGRPNIHNDDGVGQALRPGNGNPLTV